MIDKIEFTWAFVVTWNCVEPQGWPNSGLKNTFQLVIAANLDYSFVIFNYGEMAWPNRQVDKLAHAGYYLGSINRNLHLNRSIMSNVPALSHFSNCNVKGKFVLRLVHAGNHLVC